MKIGNLEVYGVIYKITNKVNGKVYIGQTKNGFNKRYAFSGQGIERVYNHHKYLEEKGYKTKCNKHLLNAINKYGFENFEVYKVFDIAFSKIELDIKEISYIKLFDCVNKGYNACEGGYYTPITFGDKHYKAKYTEDQIILAKKMYCEGETPTEINQATKVNKNDLSVITSLNSWVEVGKEYNSKLKKIQDLRKYRNSYNVKENESELRNYYDLGLSPMDVCKKLNLVDLDYEVPEGKRCSLKNYENIVSLFRLFKYRDLDRTKICNNCGEEYLIPLGKRVAHNRKYCYVCAKKVDNMNRKNRKRNNK